MDSLAQASEKKDMSELCQSPILCVLAMIGTFSLGVFLGKFWGQYATLLESQSRLNKLMDSLHGKDEKEGGYRAGTKEEEEIYLTRHGAKAHVFKYCQGLRDANYEEIKTIPMCRYCTKLRGKEVEIEGLQKVMKF